MGLTFIDEERMNQETAMKKEAESDKQLAKLNEAQRQFNLKHYGPALQAEAKAIGEMLANKYPPIRAFSTKSKGKVIWFLELPEDVVMYLGLHLLRGDDRNDPVQVYSRALGDHSIVISRKPGA